MADFDPSSRVPELIGDASRGDRVAIDALLERYLPGLRAYVRLRTGRAIAAKESSSDLVQSVCREVLEHIDRFQYRGEAQFKHWLYATALRKIGHRAEYYRAAKRDVGKEIHLGLDASSGAGLPAGLWPTTPTPSQELMRREDVEKVERAFAELPDDSREVILLSRLVGLSHAEIAEQMGRSEVAVRTLLSRALTRLAALLDRG